MYITPIGELHWVVVDGDGIDASMEKDGSKMVFQASLHLASDSKEAKEFKAKLNEVWAQYKADNKLKGKPKSLGYKELTDDNDEPTGIIEFRAKTNVTFKDGKPNKVKVFNAKGQDITEAYAESTTKIGNGSIGRLYVTLRGYSVPGNAGVSIYLAAVQIAKLVPYEGNNVEAKELDTTEDDGTDIYVAAMDEDDKKIPF